MTPTLISGGNWRSSVRTSLAVREASQIRCRLLPAFSSGPRRAGTSSHAQVTAPKPGIVGTKSSAFRPDSMEKNFVTGVNSEP